MDTSASPTPPTGESAQSESEAPQTRATARAEPRPAPSETLRVLRRWRLPIAITLILLLAENLYLRFDLLGVGIGLVGLVLLPLVFVGLVRLARSVPMAIASLFVLIVGTAALAQFLDPLPAVGIALLCALTLATRVWRFELRHLMVLQIFAALGIAFAMWFGSSALVVAAALIPPLALVGSFQWYFRRRAYEREALVEVLELAARSQLPLGAAAEAFAGLCSPGFRPHAVDLGLRLDQGLPLHEALGADPDVAEPETRLFAQIGGQWSALDRSLGDAVAATELRRTDRVSLLSTLGYPLLLLVAIGLGLLLMATFLLPKIHAIVRDFGLPSDDPAALPLEFLQRVLTILPTEPASFFAWLVLSMILASILFAIVAQLLRIQGHPIPTPGGWLERRRESAAFLRGLALGIERGRPLPEILADLGRAAPSSWGRRKVGQAGLDVARGKPWPAALQARRLIGAQERAVLSAAERAGNLPWAAREMADALERRSTHRIRVLGLFLQPITLSMLGGLVLFAALSYFLPLIAVLSRLAEEAPG